MGPTPLSKLKIEGSVDGKDDTDNILILKIDGMVAPAEELPTERMPYFFSLVFPNNSA